MNNFVVYAIVRRRNLFRGQFKYMYIGYTCNFNRRMKEHHACALNLGYTNSTKLYRRIRKHGWNAYKKIILKRNLTFDEANATEIRLIAKYDTFKNGLNSTPGGVGVRGAIGADNHKARPVEIYNNSTGEITSFKCILDADTFINGEFTGRVYRPLYRQEQTYSQKFQAWFQVKYKSDDTPFVENMLTPLEQRMGDNSPVAHPVKVYNNITREITSFGSIVAASLFLSGGITKVRHVLHKKGSQTYSPIHRAWFQVKYDFDDTPFIEIMPLPVDKNSGRNNWKAQAILLYNNNTREITPFDSVVEAEMFLNGVKTRRINDVLTKYSSSVQTYSKIHKAYFQAKYAHDETPFIENMPLPNERNSASNLGKPRSVETRRKISASKIGKHVGGDNPSAKPVVVYGVVYGCCRGASNALRDAYKLRGTFVNGWIYKNSRPNDVFRVSKDFYKQIDHDVYITRDMYNAYEHFMAS